MLNVRKLTPRIIIGSAAIANLGSFTASRDRTSVAKAVSAPQWSQTTSWSIR